MSGKQPKIITISGKARHGKNTLAELIKQELESKGKKVAIIAYGDYVKLICKTLYNWNGEKDEYGRTLLQKVGTDIVRNIDKNFWVKTVEQTIEVFNNEFNYFVIPDVRFENEITYLQDKGYDVATFYIERINFDSDLTEEQLQHPSETGINKADCDIYVKNKDIAYLEIYVKELHKEFDKIRR